MTETMPDSNHSIESAMARGELTDEEAYFVLRFAGRIGYTKAIFRLSSNKLSKIISWFIWFGGWDTPELLRWDRGWPRWGVFKDGRFTDPSPISLFGHRFTYYGWGWHLRVGRGWFTWCFRDGAHWSPKVYWSKDGTPHHESLRVIIS